eukprot:9483131-Pyramimonas_sp.AAC.2
MPSSLDSAPRGNLPGNDPHPLLVLGVIEVDGRDAGADEALGPVEPEQSFMEKIGTASSYVIKFNNLMTVAQSWLEMLEDNKWNEKLREAVSRC